MGTPARVHRARSRPARLRHVGWLRPGWDLVRQGRGVHLGHERCDSQRSTCCGQRSTGPWSAFADLDFNPQIADTFTLSTFHGCPPEEIESITKHLIDAHELDVIVKLNPTLLGYETVAGIVNDELGYVDVSVKESAFADDLQFDRGIELIEELNQYAKDRGRLFGIKLTNTLVVDNNKQWMPDETMYLSGPPLHVLASSLFAAPRRRATWPLRRSRATTAMSW